jgi:hypothetical protein
LAVHGGKKFQAEESPVWNSKLFMINPLTLSVEISR